MVDGEVVYTSPEFGGFDGADDTVETVVVDGLGISGEFDVEINNLAPSGDAHVTFDNIRWK